MQYDEHNQHSGEVSPEELIGEAALPPGEMPIGALLIMKTMGVDGEVRIRYIRDTESSIFEHLGFLINATDELRTRINMAHPYTDEEE